MAGAIVGGAGPKPRCTYCEFTNNTSEEMIYKDSPVWNGSSIPSDFKIAAKQQNHFKHDAIGIGSIGGIALTQNKTDPDVIWIVAWSNKVNTDNQVYISVTGFVETVDWDYIKAQLDSANTKNHSESHSSKADIDLTSDAPSMKAELNKKVDA